MQVNFSSTSELVVVLSHNFISADKNFKRKLTVDFSNTVDKVRLVFSLYWLREDCKSE